MPHYGDVDFVDLGLDLVEARDEEERQDYPDDADCSEDDSADDEEDCRYAFNYVHSVVIVCGLDGNTILFFLI